MEEKKKVRLDELTEKMKSGSGLTGSEKEEHRLLNMEHLAEMLPQDDDED